jgi:hypothetical protein
VLRADNLTTFMCRLSRNLEASTSWNPKGLSKPVMGLLYLSFLVVVVGLLMISVLYEISMEMHITFTSNEPE